MNYNAPLSLKKQANINNALFSIFIPSWNNLSYLKLCIESIRKNSTYPHQIIVHVNEGADGTLRWIEQQSDIDYSFSPKNIGVCYALNSCRTLATASYFVYLNDDMYVCPGWDEALYKEIQAIGHPYFFLSSTAIEPMPQSNCAIQKNYGKTIKEFQEEKLLVEYAQLPMNNWEGASWPPNIVHKDIWDLIGGYSIEFSPGWYSDPDFSMKLWQTGIRIFKGVANSRVYHFGSVSTKRIKPGKGYHIFVSKWGITQHTFMKHFLKRGSKYAGNLTETKLSLGLKINNVYKQLRAAFLR